MTADDEARRCGCGRPEDRSYADAHAPDTAALRALAETHGAAYDLYVGAGVVAVPVDTVRALCDAADEVERLRGVVERVAWRTARIVGAVSRDVIEPLPEGYNLEDLHAKLQTMLGIERTDLAALVADLRIYATTGIGVATLRALLDRHSPEEGS